MVEVCPYMIHYYIFIIHNSSRSKLYHKIVVQSYVILCVFSITLVCQGINTYVVWIEENSSMIESSLAQRATTW